MLITLPADDALPDSTFIEDTALILPRQGAILTRPGATSRMAEVEAVGEALRAFFPELGQIMAPGTLDAGDVCEAGATVFVGISHRTNVEGARQLAAWLQPFGFTTRMVDIRETPGILHLKSGVVALDADHLLCIDALATQEVFASHHILRVPAGEEYAANCVRINEVIFVADGFPATHTLLSQAGYTLEALSVGEFAKMDGGLSCLSLRFS